ncbi:MAG: HIT domain-containing protein [Proteobacteria bacterium]|nr:HIT domain-containing protein [Pseudomonadota bacterium]MBS0464418.1 HIT domain-containing protein [Pseudomonadota bacterium]
MSAPATGFVLHARLAADSVAVGLLELSELRLMNDARFPWLILVPRIADISDYTALPARAQAALWDEIGRCAQALKALYAPTRVNIGLLGNLVPQLHAHVVARFDHDAAWPGPVWGAGTAVAYDPSAATACVRAIGRALDC